MVHSIFDPEILRPRKADAQRERSRDVLTYVHALYEAVSKPRLPVTFDLPARKDVLIRSFRFTNLRLGDI
jgi:hypothetical protein